MPGLRRWGLAAALVGGLALRAAFLTSGGTHDVAYDVVWGRRTNALGFAHYYYGNYFPLQYHVFQFAAWSSHVVGIGGPTALKATVVVADVALAAVLLLIARRLSLGLLLPLSYWLSPYFVVMDWLGYVDVQMGVFATLAILMLTGGRTPVHLLASGLFLGSAMMMKPQALTLLVTLAALIVLGLVWSHSRRRLARDGALLFAGPAFLFVTYSAWLAAAGRGLGFLARTMVEFGNFQGPALTANMTNVWMVFAQAYRRGGQPAYSVMGPHYSAFQAVAAVTTVAVVLGGVALVARRIDVMPFHLCAIAVFAFGAMSVPSTMTRAHENHFFLGAVFGLIAAAAFRTTVCAVAVHATLVLQMITLFSLYGFGANGPHWAWVKHWQGYFLDNQGALWGGAGALSFVAYCVAIFSLFVAVRDWTPLSVGEAETSTMLRSPLVIQWPSWNTHAGE